VKRDLLKLRNFSVSISGRRILSALDFEISAHSMNVLMGPGGAGKSTLLRTLSGLTNLQPDLKISGKARYLGQDLFSGELPGVSTQSPRLVLSTVLEFLVSALPDRSSMTRPEQIEFISEILSSRGAESLIPELQNEYVSLDPFARRLLSVLRPTMTRPALLCLDEPTAGLDEDQAEPILHLLRKLQKEMALLVATHNQEHARALGGRVLLLAEGKIVEDALTETFFEKPKSEEARQYLRTGGCSLESPTIEEEEEDDLVDSKETPPPLIEPRRYTSEARGPRGFRWLLAGWIGGTPRPGVTDSEEYDLAALRRVGTTWLITLTEGPLGIDTEKWEFRNSHFPMPDMGVPDLEDARRLMQEVQDALDSGEVVVFHCLAGLGRTGTMLAAHLIHKGMSASEAIKAARRSEPRWIQSEVQEGFLGEFEQLLKSNNGDEPHNIKERSCL